MALLQIAEPGLAAAPHQHRLAVGIDLGTTNSLVATVASGMAKALADESGHILLPSVVHYGETEMVVGREARRQVLEKEGRLPTALIASVGGGSNAMGLFQAFLEDESVRIYGVEPAGRGLDTPGDHAATMTLGSPGVLHGMQTIVLQDEAGEPWPVHSIASGLDYPGVGPQHAHLRDLGRVDYVTATDDETLDAFQLLCRAAGFPPAIESSHAVAHAMKLAPTLGADDVIVVNLSGRGDKDIDFVAERLGMS